jgi:hypothetical protein
VRRGRALRPHPRLLDCGDGRQLVSRAIIVHLTGQPATTVRRYLEPVACDVATHSVLYDYAEAQAWAATRTERPAIPGPRRPCD